MIWFREGYSVYVSITSVANMAFQENEQSADNVILMPTLDTCPKQNPPLSQKLSCLNTGIRKQCTMKLFQTISQSKMLWDHGSKPRGILGGHLNIHSIILRVNR